MITVGNCDVAHTIRTLQQIFPNQIIYKKEKGAQNITRAPLIGITKYLMQSLAVSMQAVVLQY